MEAARALDVHEEAVRRLNQSLELVLGLLIRGRRVKQILGHFLEKKLRENLCKLCCQQAKSNREKASLP